MSKKKRIALRILILCVAGAALLLWMAFTELRDRKAGTDYYADLREIKPVEAPAETPCAAETDAAQTEETEKAEQTGNAPSQMDFEALAVTMPDICGWITIPGTDIDYPIVHGEDNEFYLAHLPDGTPNSAGSIMMDAVNSPDWTDDVSVLHGHHMRAGNMFGRLGDYADAEFASEHSVMLLYTPAGDYEVHVVAACVVDAYEFEYITGFVSEEDFEGYINPLIEASAYKTDIEVTQDDRFILLSTCDYEFENARFVVLGVLKEK